MFILLNNFKEKSIYDKFKLKITLHFEIYLIII